MKIDLLQFYESEFYEYAKVVVGGVITGGGFMFFALVVTGIFF